MALVASDSDRYVKKLPAFLKSALFIGQRPDRFDGACRAGSTGRFLRTPASRWAMDPAGAASATPLYRSRPALLRRRVEESPALKDLAHVLRQDQKPSHAGLFDASRPSALNIKLKSLYPSAGMNRPIK